MARLSKSAAQMLVRAAKPGGAFGPYWPPRTLTSLLSRGLICNSYTAGKHDGFYEATAAGRHLLSQHEAGIPTSKRKIKTRLQLEAELREAKRLLRACAGDRFGVMPLSSEDAAYLEGLLAD